MAKPNGSFCMDCDQNTSELREFYMLEQPVWESVIKVSEQTGMLCVGCVEIRLQRRLEPADFNPKWSHLCPFPSNRLLDRRGY